MKPQSDKKKSSDNTHSCTANTKKERSGEENRWNRYCVWCCSQFKNNIFTFSNWSLKAKCTEFVVFLSSVVASDVSSDDEPLIQMKTALAASKSPRANGTNKNAGGHITLSHQIAFIAAVCCLEWITYIFTFCSSDPNTDESSDSEPLIKMAKVSSKAAKKTFSRPPKKSVDKKKQGKIFFFLQWPAASSENCCCL